jgi:hypothetical protein
MSDPWLQPGTWTAINVFAGACLGGSFYVLIKTKPFLSNRSYDPKYNASYISRFITGVIAGVILAYGLPGLLGADGINTVLTGTLTPGVLGILGGFSAEAVEVILQRLVDIILAAVRGDGTNAIQSKANGAAAAKISKAEKALDVAIDAHNSSTTPSPKVQEALKTVRNELAMPTKT